MVERSQPLPTPPPPPPPEEMDFSTSETVLEVVGEENLKETLKPIVEIMRRVYSDINVLIQLADARQSENIAQKAETASVMSAELVEALSTYRDSIGPVTRMKVNQHLTGVESSHNDFSSVASRLPRIATATDLEKMSKTLSQLCTNIEKLAVALPNL